MKLKFLLLLLITGLKSFSQFRDTYQPSVLYKQNSVRSRTMFFDYDKGNSGIIDYFDHDGFMIEHIEFDSTGKNYLVRNKFIYDTSHKLVREIFYDYRRKDSVAKPVGLNIPVHTQDVKIELDSMGMWIKKIYLDTAGKIFYEIEVFRSLYTIEEKFFNAKDWFDVIAGCDEHGIEKNINIKHYLPDSSIQTMEIKFKNFYAKDGRLIKRKSQAIFPDTLPFPHFQRHEYFYMSNGLLASRKSYKQKDGQEYIYGVLFNYKFW